MLGWQNTELNGRNGVLEKYSSSSDGFVGTIEHQASPPSITVECQNSVTAFCVLCVLRMLWVPQQWGFCGSRAGFAAHLQFLSPRPSQSPGCVSVHPTSLWGCPRVSPLSALIFHSSVLIPRPHHRPFHSWQIPFRLHSWEKVCFQTDRQAGP